LVRASERSAGAQRLAHDILEHLIEINPTDSNGSTTLAAGAMAQRLREAGFAAVEGADLRSALKEVIAQTVTAASLSWRACIAAFL
jgi:hypothetical protein